MSSNVEEQGKKPETSTSKNVTFPFMSKTETAAITIPASDAVKSPQSLRDLISKYGVVLVTDVVSSEECATLEEIWQRDLVSLVDRSKVVTKPQCQQLQKLEAKNGLKVWTQEYTPHVGKTGLGFASRRGLPHGRYAWTCRLHPTVKELFAAIHNVPANELAVGLDNTFWSDSGSEQMDDNREWLHCDQNHKTGLTWPCVQGVLYTWACDKPRCSTTVVWPGSHRAEIYDQIMADPRAAELCRTAHGQLVQLNTLYSDAGVALHKLAVADARRVPVPAGSLLLWDSRTTHQGWRGGPRLAQPVCWEPRERRDTQALRRKLWMCATGCPSSHSSTEGRVHSLGPRQLQTTLAASEDTPPRLPLLASIVPFGVRPDAEDLWQTLQPALWQKKTSWKNADAADVTQLDRLLKDDVRNAL